MSEQVWKGMTLKEFSDKTHQTFIQGLKETHQYKEVSNPKKPKEREYQKALIGLILGSFTPKKLISSAEIACGQGKTFIAAMTAKAKCEKGKKILFITANKTALGDEEQGNIADFRVVFNHLNKQQWVFNSIDSRNDIFFYNIDSFVKFSENKVEFDKFMRNIGFIILDEVHRMPESEEFKVINKIEKELKKYINKNKIPTLAMTATFYRMDEALPFGINKVDVKRNIAEAVTEGYAPEVYGIPVRIDMEYKDRKRVKDSFKISFNNHKDREKYFDLIAQNIKLLHNTHKKQKQYSPAHCVFVRSIADCSLLCKKLNNLFKDLYPNNAFGILCSNTKDDDGQHFYISDTERREFIKKIDSGEMAGFITVNVGSEAINIRRLEYCHLVVRTASTVKLTQMIGRVLRLYSKDSCGFDKSSPVWYDKHAAVVVDYKFMKEKVIDTLYGCDLLSWAKREGSEATKDDTGAGGRLFKRKNKPETSLVGVSFAEEEAWLLKNGVTKEEGKFDNYVELLKLMAKNNVMVSKENMNKINELGTQVGL